MYNVQFSLATTIYKKWVNLLKHTPEYQKCGDFSQFASTMQFAFGTDKFIACGRLGDGTFLVRKSEEMNTKNSKGIFTLNDGISGVTQTRVITVPHLLNNPNALQISFFKTKEILDIIITSDGMTNLVGENITKTINFIRQIDETNSYKERCKLFVRCASMCADYNETNYGSGDDSSIAYVRLKKVKA